MMQKVLIVAERITDQEYLRALLQADESLQISTANPRQVNLVNLKKIRRSNLILLAGYTPLGSDRASERLLGVLKQSGVPILLLSLEKDDLATNREPLMLNLTAVRLAQPGIVTLIHRVRARLGIEAEWLTSMDTDSPRLELPLPSAATPTEVAPAYLPAEKTPTQAVPIPALATNSTQKGKLLSGLTAVERITKELREPLSNMNLAIHMLEKEQSLEKRDHYLSLLREEYQRELQLVNELELVQASLQALL